MKKWYFPVAWASSQSKWQRANAHKFTFSTELIMLNYLAVNSLFWGPVTSHGVRCVIPTHTSNNKWNLDEYRTNFFDDFHRSQWMILVVHSLGYSCPFTLKIKYIFSALSPVYMILVLKYQCLEVDFLSLWYKNALIM